jgi:hypothetical protein
VEPGGRLDEVGAARLSGLAGGPDPARADERRLDDDLQQDGRADGGPHGRHLGGHHFPAVPHRRTEVDDHVDLAGAGRHRRGGLRGLDRGRVRPGREAGHGGHGDPRGQRPGGDRQPGRRDADRAHAQPAALLGETGHVVVGGLGGQQRVVDHARKHGPGNGGGVLRHD